MLSELVAKWHEWADALSNIQSNLAWHGAADELEAELRENPVVAVADLLKHLNIAGVDATQCAWSDCRFIEYHDRPDLNGLPHWDDCPVGKAQAESLPE